MTPGETIAAVLPFACLVAALFRARLVALALAPVCPRRFQGADRMASRHIDRVSWIAAMRSERGAHLLFLRN